MTTDEAIRNFEDYNNFKIDNFHSDRRTCRNEGLIHDQYIGHDIFESYVDLWKNNFDSEESEAALRLLSHYTYVTEIQYGVYLDELVEKVIEECGGDRKILENTYFITFPSSKGVKSGGDVIRAELPLGYLGEISKNQMIADYKKNINQFKSKSKVIVFIDDIIGSGRTAYQNIKSCMDEINIKKDTRTKIIMAVLFAHKDTIEEKANELKSEGYNVKIIVLNECKKCFQKNFIFHNEEYQINFERIKKIEEEIAGKKLGENNSFAMGFENSQFLVSFFYNTPNNSLCMFWKVSNYNFPLFMRTSYKRPNITDIKRNRESRKKNAYEAGRLSRIDNERNNNSIIHT